MKRIIAMVLAALLTSACASKLKKEELAGVAKDWAMTIRASQIVPVYPLTEDLQPGDLFLVTTPIQQQADQYKQKGFLPLDQHLARLRPIDLAVFYSDSFGTKPANANAWPKTAPDLWRFPGGVKDWTEPAAGARTAGATAWTQAPAACFPDYTFKVRTGKGVSLALPIQSVPVGLNIMQTDAATGSVALSDASTYGVTLAELDAPVGAWAGDEATRALLESERRQAGHSIYVRVIGRVFLIRQVTVSLSNDRAFGVEAKAGAAPAVNIPVLTQGDADANRQSIEKAAAAAPSLDVGGTVKIISASGRTVHAQETFKRPLVVGYLAYDYPVMDDGRLGAPIMTLTQLQGNAPVPGRLSPDDQSWTVYSYAAQRLSPAAQAKLLDEAARHLGSSFMEAFKAEQAANPATRWDAFYTAAMRQKLTSTRLNGALRRAWSTVRPDLIKEPA